MANKSVTESEQGEILPTADELVEYACDLEDEDPFPQDDGIACIQGHEIWSSGQATKTVAMELQCQRDGSVLEPPSLENQ